MLRRGKYIRNESDSLLKMLKFRTSSLQLEYVKNAVRLRENGIVGSYCTGRTKDFSRRKCMEIQFLMTCPYFSVKRLLIKARRL